MSQARDIIADASDTPPSLAGAGADDILAALRGAANASPGDSIVIGPDGDVGRLVYENEIPRGPLYRVVTP